MSAFRSFAVLLLASLCACSSRRTVVVTPKPARQVEIEVEVYDPETNFVWEGVNVRAVEGYHEWSGCTCPTGDPDLWLLTDEFGRVLFTSSLLADAEIGFLEDDAGHAIIESDRDLDEAFVLIELDALGFDRAQFDVPLTWSEPSVFVSLPFSEPQIAAAARGAGAPRLSNRLATGAPSSGGEGLPRIRVR